MGADYEGIFPALSTPFIQSNISLEKFKENIEKYNKVDLAGYVVLGSTGESVYLNDEESEKLVIAAKSTASPEKKIIVGTARESTEMTLDFTNRMAALGIDAALIRTPSYFTSDMTSQALKKHYLTIADRAKIPVLIYNIPQCTGIFVDKGLIIDLSSHPNIAGLKDSSGNLAFLAEVAPSVRSGFSILLGAGDLMLPGLLLGAKGGILRLADVAPGLCVKLYKLFLDGRIEEARQLQLQLVPLNNAVIKDYGISGLKYALDLAGYFGGLPRSPLLPLISEGKKQIENILKNLDLLKKE